MEWFCKNCCSVIVSHNLKCCGEVVEFDVAEHGRLLIPSANGWARINKKWDEKWKRNKLVSNISSLLTEDGCSSLPTHIVAAVDALIEFYDENHSPND